MSARRVASGLAHALLLSLSVSCAGQTTDPLRLDVFAASSLTEAFDAIALEFEGAHPGVTVVPTYGGSQFLRLQIEQGAPATVYASADAEHVRALEQAGLVSEVEAFATNALIVIVPPDNPAGIQSFADLYRARRIVLGEEAVPVGDYTRQVLDRAAATLGADFRSRVQAAVVSRESNVRLVRAKVELGEADAAIVYRTDAAATDLVRTVPIPAEINVRAEYFVGVVQGAPSTDVAREWIRFVRSARGRALLEDHGFEADR